MRECFLDADMRTEDFSGGSGMYVFHSAERFLRDSSLSASPENSRRRGSTQSSAEYRSPRYATSVSSISDKDMDVVRNCSRIFHAPLSYSADAWFPVSSSSMTMLAIFNWSLPLWRFGAGSAPLDPARLDMILHIMINNSDDKLKLLRTVKSIPKSTLFDSRCYLL